MEFIYTDKTKGIFDLKIFSNMNASEGIMLYLIMVHGGLEITKVCPTNTSRIEAIGLNGQVFTPNTR